MNKMHEVGQYIEIDECDYFDLVGGHVDEAQAIEAMKPYGIHIPKKMRLEHKYARWMPDHSGRFDMVLQLSEKGRGAFPVTEVIDEERRIHA